MRKIDATEIYTIDGMISDSEEPKPAGIQDWITANYSQDMGEAVDDVYKRSDTLFLGAVTYKIMASYWPTANTNPDAFGGDAEFAATMNNLKKIVFSKTPLTPEWKNSEFRAEINADEIRKMKEAPGKDMLIAGSASIVQQFINLDLVDEYHLFVHPVILAVGKPLFKEIKNRQTLKLLETKTFTNDVVLLHYQAK